MTKALKTLNRIQELKLKDLQKELNEHYVLLDDLYAQIKKLDDEADQETELSKNIDTTVAICADMGSFYKKIQQSKEVLFDQIDDVEARINNTLAKLQTEFSTQKTYEKLLSAHLERQKKHTHDKSQKNRDDMTIMQFNRQKKRV